jgi:pyruvate dehydrogenase E2 component (dihydrolipoamide acetyltransferase)
MAEFRMPSLGADMEAGKLVEWLKAPGERVRRGDIIAVVETQKGAIEIEVFEDGVLRQLLVEPGATVPVGTPLAVIDGAGVHAAVVPASPTHTPARPVAGPTTPAIPRPVAPSRGRASPAARRIAEARGIDLAGVRGTGPGGAVTTHDLPAEPAVRQARPSRGIDFAEMRRAIAAAMARSKREIPHYYLVHTIDVTAAQQWLASANDGKPPSERILFAAVLLKVVAAALHEAPELNGFYTRTGFEPSKAIHLGVAVAMRGGGLIAPAIHEVDRLTLAETMARLRDLVARVRSGQLRSSELSDPTITVTSLGERGVEGVFGVIYPPQVAIIGFGVPVERPWVKDGVVSPRTVLSTSLAADHRASDGHRGARFLRELDRLLQTPEKL